MAGTVNALLQDFAFLPEFCRARGIPNIHISYKYNIYIKSHSMAVLYIDTKFRCGRQACHLLIDIRIEKNMNYKNLLLSMRVCMHSLRGC